MLKNLYHSPFGILVIIVAGGSLIYCNWDSEDCKRKQTLIESKLPSDFNTDDISLLEKVVSQLDEYFTGKRSQFELPLKFTGTIFQKKVWKQLLDIEFGSVISYKELALRLNNPKAVRAIAGACGANPIAIISPCHRVISSNYKLGGYTGGIDKKTALLCLEKHIVKDNMLIP